MRAAEATWRGLGEVITLAGLVVNDGDEAGRAGAEGVLGCGICDTAGGQGRDVDRGTVGAALHLVEWAGGVAVQGASGAVRGDARRAPREVEVARSCGDR